MSDWTPNILGDVEKALKLEMPIGYWYDFFDVSRFKFLAIMGGTCLNSEEEKIYFSIAKKASQVLGDNKSKANIDEALEKCKSKMITDLKEGVEDLRDE